MTSPGLMFQGRVDVVNTKSGWSAMTLVIALGTQSRHCGYGSLLPITRGIVSVDSAQPILRYVTTLKWWLRPRMSSAVSQCSACEPPASAMVRVAFLSPYVHAITDVLAKSPMQPSRVDGG